uniref:Secreted protein n=1 Tax=Suricata suricatta TaxID=37032 RepID=A0A673TTY2_SURSU
MWEGPGLAFMLLLHSIFTIHIHSQFCLVYMKNEVTKICCYVLKLKPLFEKPPNWCLHYIMIHTDESPNQAI